MPTTDELRKQWANVRLHSAYSIIDDLSVVFHDAITELEARDREIQTWKDTVRDRTYELSQAKREIAELRDELAEERRRLDHAGDVLESRVYSLDEAYEREKIAKDVAYRWWKQARWNNYDAWAHVRRAERWRLRAEAEVKEYEFLFCLQKDRLDTATAAWREATGQHNVSPDLGVLLEWLLNRIDELEANLAMAEYDTSPQVSADRDTKVASDATILQEKDTHFACKKEEA